MSIEQESVIDIIAPGVKSNEVTLIITDHLAWVDGADYDHVVKLQNKINSYVSFIESGELVNEYPEHRGKLAIIHVEGKYPLNRKAGEFYERAARVLANAGILLKFEHDPYKPGREASN